MAAREMQLKIQMMVSFLLIVLHGEEANLKPIDQEICIPHQISEIERGLFLGSSEMKSRYVYTPFQCMDHCIRDDECDGFTLDMNTSSSSSTKKECQLFRNITSKARFNDQDRKRRYLSLEKANQEKLIFPSAARGCGTLHTP